MRLHKRRARVLAALAVLVLVALSAWFAYQHHQRSARMIASIVPYNHTDIAVVDFYVDGSWGGISDPHTGGGRSLCCVSIPRLWHADLKMTVKWKKTLDPNWHYATVEVPRYDKPGELQVHFLKDDRVRVFVLYGWANRPDHPLYQELYGGKP